MYDQIEAILCVCDSACLVCSLCMTNVFKGQKYTWDLVLENVDAIMYMLVIKSRSSNYWDISWTPYVRSSYNVLCISLFIYPLCFWLAFFSNHSQDLHSLFSSFLSITKSHCWLILAYLTCVICVYTYGLAYHGPQVEIRDKFWELIPYWLDDKCP